MTGDEDDDDFMSRHFPDARPVSQTRKAPVSRKPLPHRRQQTEPAEIPAPPGRINDDNTTAGEVLSYAGNGIQKRVLSQLRRGDFTIGGRLDLHGMTVIQAHREVDLFIERCRQSGYRYALIIHGRGARSAGNVPVLKINLKHWLTEDPDVLAFHSARDRDGGTGAVYVLLRSAGSRNEPGS